MAVKVPIPSRSPAVKVQVNSRDLPDAAYGDLMGVTISEEDRGTASFELQMLSWHREKLKLSWADSTLFSPGGRVAITMGYTGVMSAIMLGEITSLDLDVEAGEVPTLTVRGYDLGHVMARTTTSHHYVKLTDAGIVEEIAAKYKLTPKITRPFGPELVHESVVQFNQTDLGFLEERAERLGYEVKVRGGDLVFGPRQGAKPPSIKLSAEQDLVSFSASASTKGMVDAVEVLGWDQAKKEIIKGSCDGTKLKPQSGRLGGAQAKKAFGAAKVVVVDARVSSPAEADQIAKGKLEELSGTFVQASCTCFGRADLRAGAEVEIEGIGARFGGVFEITRASHVYNAKGASYRTSLTMRRNAT